MLLWRVARSLKGVVQNGFSEPARQLPFPRRISAIHRQAAPSSLNPARAIYDHLVSRLKTNFSSPAFSRTLHSSHPSSHRSYSRARNAPGLGAPCLPRPPRVPGNVSHVGLGTARNFSTARPIFQHLVENVPVAGRTINEIDWDLKMREQRHSFALGQEKTKSKHRVAEPFHKAEAYISNPAVANAQEIQHYFQMRATPSVTTYLRIPLAPTPTLHVALPSSSSAPPHLLPLSALAQEHALHSKHAIRVSSLFGRLDTARVWERGALCETYGDPSGLCTVLCVKFEGWTEDMVKQVLGLAGRDWCSIQEISTECRGFEILEGSTSSDITPVIAEETLHQSSSSSTDMTFVMPTIDMSADFEWDLWETMPSRSSSSPTSDEGSHYSFLDDSSTISEWTMEWFPSDSRSAFPSPSPGLIDDSE